MSNDSLNEIRIVSQDIRPCFCTLEDGTEIELKPFISKVERLKKPPFYWATIGTTFKVKEKRKQKRIQS